MPVPACWSYPTDPEDLWAACTSIERIPRWFLPITGDRARSAPDCTSSMWPTLTSEFGPGAVGIGWDLGLVGLATYLETGATQDPGAAAAAWMGGDDGRRFMALGVPRVGGSRIRGLPGGAVN